MEELEADLIDISDEVRNHLRTEIKLMKIEVVDHLSHHLASILSRVFILILAVVAYTFFCVCLGLYLAQFMALWMSFGLITLFSLLVLLLVYIFNETLVQGPIRDFFIKTLALKFDLR